MQTLQKSTIQQEIRIVILDNTKHLIKKDGIYKLNLKRHKRCPNIKIKTYCSDITSKQYQCAKIKFLTK